MKRFVQVFKKKHCHVIGMIHVDALPGTPNYSGNFSTAIAKARHEASIYAQTGVDAVLIENMNDVPYQRDNKLGPEITAAMTRIAVEVKTVVKQMPCGIQVLACGNKQALAVAKVADCQFIRAEGFVFSHIADEGFTDSCASELLRYRKQIDANDIMIFTDIKKKHSSHSITDDVSLLETAKAAEFFLSDGVILTGTATGEATDTKDVQSVHKKVKIPIIIGSGVTLDNLIDFYDKSNAVIIGSHFKTDGKWASDLSGKRVRNVMERVEELRST